AVRWSFANPIRSQPVAPSNQEVRRERPGFSTRVSSSEILRQGSQTLMHVASRFALHGGDDRKPPLPLESSDEGARPLEKPNASGLGGKGSIELSPPHSLSRARGVDFDS